MPFKMLSVILSKLLINLFFSSSFIRVTTAFISGLISLILFKEDSKTSSIKISFLSISIKISLAFFFQRFFVSIFILKNHSLIYDCISKKGSKKCKNIITMF